MLCVSNNNRNGSIVVRLKNAVHLGKKSSPLSLSQSFAVDALSKQSVKHHLGTILH